MSQSLPAADLLYGNAAIAAFLGMTVRQVKARTADGEIPTFRIGQRRGIVASRDRLRKWLAELGNGPAPARASRAGAPAINAAAGL